MLDVTCPFYYHLFQKWIGRGYFKDCQSGIFSSMTPTQVKLCVPTQPYPSQPRLQSSVTEGRGPGCVGPTLSNKWLPSLKFHLSLCATLGLPNGRGQSSGEAWQWGMAAFLLYAGPKCLYGLS